MLTYHKIHNQLYVTLEVAVIKIKCFNDLTITNINILITHQYGLGS